MDTRTDTTTEAIRTIRDQFATEAERDAYLMRTQWIYDRWNNLGYEAGRTRSKVVEMVLSGGLNDPAKLRELAPLCFKLADAMDEADAAYARAEQDEIEHARQNGLLPA